MRYEIRDDIPPPASSTAGSYEREHNYRLWELQPGQCLVGLSLNQWASIRVQASKAKKRTGRTYRTERVGLEIRVHCIAPS